MGLISVANAKLYTDKMALAYLFAQKTVGLASGSVVAGTSRDAIRLAVANIAVSFDDLDPVLTIGADPTGQP